MGDDKGKKARGAMNRYQRREISRFNRWLFEKKSIDNTFLFKMRNFKRREAILMFFNADVLNHLHPGVCENIEEAVNLFGCFLGNKLHTMRKKVNGFGNLRPPNPSAVSFLMRLMSSFIGWIGYSGQFSSRIEEMFLRFLDGKEDNFVTSEDFIILLEQLPKFCTNRCKKSSLRELPVKFRNHLSAGFVKLLVNLYFEVFELVFVRSRPLNSGCYIVEVTMERFKELMTSRRKEIVSMDQTESCKKDSVANELSEMVNTKKENIEEIVKVVESANVGSDSEETKRMKAVKDGIGSSVEPDAKPSTKGMNRSSARYATIDEIDNGASLDDDLHLDGRKLEDSNNEKYRKSGDIAIVSLVNNGKGLSNDDSVGPDAEGLNKGVRKEKKQAQHVVDDENIQNSFQVADCENQDNPRLNRKRRYSEAEPNQDSNSDENIVVKKILSRSIKDVEEVMRDQEMTDKVKLKCISLITQNHLLELKIHEERKIKRMDRDSSVDE